MARRSHDATQTSTSDVDDFLKEQQSQQRQTTLSPWITPKHSSGKPRKLNEDELYVYVVYHRAVYVTQYTIHELRRRILGTNKRESSSEIVRYYTCPKCLSSWPLIDVIDNADRDGGFLCKRCVTPSLLREEPLTTDLLPRFNQQFAPFIQILERLD
ncbi:transcription initiation factor IIE subunit alpha, partial [Colletotrichum abscissum]|uniref:transcription initiation factor IIE subunit alpha n=1 Tax=Colletotrichum abscissum TaxID=1671311 RepID=UPI0027D51D5F